MNNFKSVNQKIETLNEYIGDKGEGQRECECIKNNLRRNKSLSISINIKEAKSVVKYQIFKKHILMTTLQTISEYKKRGSRFSCFQLLAD